MEDLRPLYAAEEARNNGWTEALAAARAAATEQGLDGASRWLTCRHLPNPIPPDHPPTHWIHDLDGEWSTTLWCDDCADMALLTGRCQACGADDRTTRPRGAAQPGVVTWIAACLICHPDPEQ